MPKDVFISYARKASQAHAQALHAALGQEVAYLDTEEIPFGEVFPEHLVDALLESRVAVILASPLYFASWYCLLEYRLARMPFLHLARQPGVSREESDAALAGVVVALPEGEADPMLDRFPAAVRVRNWVPANDTASLAEVVRKRLADGLPTLRERYDALGELGTIRDIVLETTLLPAPRRIGGIPAVPLVGLPRSIHDRFVGRADDIWRIHDVLTTAPGEACAAALTGAIEAGGGFGKTRLALEYLYRFGTRYFNGGLFWIDAAQDPEDQLYDVVKALDPSAPEPEALRAVHGGVADALVRTVRSRSDDAPLLFVIDNVPEADSGTPPRPLSHWCPVAGEVAVLATSRTQVALGGPGSIVPVPIDTLRTGSAVLLLAWGAARGTLGEDDWREIAEWVGNLPLALELLNGLLLSGAMNAADLLAMSRNDRPGRALDSACDVLRGVVPAGALRGVTEAFTESYLRIAAGEQHAARLIAWMSPAVVPDAVLERLDGSPFTPSVRATLRTRHFVTPPIQASRTGLPGLYGSMHRVLADFLRSRAVQASREIALVLDASLHAIEGHQGDEGRRIIDLVAPAVSAVVTNLFQMPFQAGDAEDLVDHLIPRIRAITGCFLDAGAYRWVAVCGEIAAHGCMQVIGEEHQATLEILMVVAYAHGELGRYSEAGTVERRVLEVLRRVLGEEDEATLATMNNLAATLWAQGDFPGAQALHEKVWAARSRTLGDEHPSTLNSLNNLAETLVSRGDYARAQEIHERVLAAKQRTLGSEHLDTLLAMGNLAATLRLSARGDVARARELDEWVLATRRGVQGDDHPDTLHAMNALALTLWKAGDAEAGRALLERALAARRLVLGEHHPDTTISAWNLVLLLDESRDVQRANEVVRENLSWLLQHGAETLGIQQREIKAGLSARGALAG